MQEMLLSLPSNRSFPAAEQIQNRVRREAKGKLLRQLMGRREKVQTGTVVSIGQRRGIVLKNVDGVVTGVVVLLDGLLHALTDAGAGDVRWVLARRRRLIRQRGVPATLLSASHP